MYIHTGACPLCGAPILARVTREDHPRPIYDAHTGFWEHVPQITYTCACRLPPEAPAKGLPDAPLPPLP